MHRERQVVAALRGQRVVQRLQRGREVAEGAGGGGHQRAGLAQRLAGVAGLDTGDARGIGLDAIGDAVQEARALMRLQVAPGGIGLRH